MAALWVSALCLVAPAWTARGLARGPVPSTAPPRAPIPRARPAASDAATERSLVGFEKFVRSNPRTDRFQVLGFDHLEFYCADATNTAGRFMHGLGMQRVSVHANAHHAHSVCTQSGGMRFVFTAPAGVPPAGERAEKAAPMGFNRRTALDFVAAHGLAVRAVCLRVADAEAAYTACVEHGADSAMPPVRVGADCTAAEVVLYGDVVLRLLSAADAPPGPQVPLLPGHSVPTLPGIPSPSAGTDADAFQAFTRVDHVVGNVPRLAGEWERIARMTGFHEFAEFTAEDVGTVDSGLNSVVLASNNEMVLLPLNEPTHGTRRVSQIQTYLDLHGGPGVQHIAMLTPDIFSTVRAMRWRTSSGGFGFMPRPSEAYYRELPERLGLGKPGGPPLTQAQLDEAEALGILVDRDDQGVLLQIFTAPVGDRATLFLEVIQRIGCEEDGKPQRGGCGGFGKGNFRELFKTVEDFLEDR